jgi:hypothetical protein
LFAGERDKKVARRGSEGGKRYGGAHKKEHDRAVEGFYGLTCKS